MQTIPGAKASEITFNEALLRLAALHGRIVEFRYEKSKDSPIETRRFVPKAVAETNAGNIIIVGEDDDREGIRGFRLDRIKGDVSLP